MWPPIYCFPILQSPLIQLVQLINLDEKSRNLVKQPCEGHRDVKQVQFDVVEHGIVYYIQAMSSPSSNIIKWTTASFRF